MKIIIVSPSLDTTKNVSGISSVTQFIIDNNPNHNYLPFAVGKRDDEIRNFTWFYRLLALYFNWLRILITLKNGTIHFNLALSKRSLIRDTPLILLSKIFYKKMIIHLHGGELLTKNNIPFWVYICLKCIFMGENPKIVQSSLEAESLKRRFKCRKVFVLPNCVDIKEAKGFDRPISTHEELRLLFLSRISIEKGIEYIFQALKSLKEQGIRYKFIMAGKGPDGRQYIQKFKDLLQEDFDFKGVVFGDQKNELLKYCDVYLLPSFFEGLPMALLESMSFGLVPVTTEVGSIRTVVSNMNNGIFVRVKSTGDIVDAIKLLSEKKEYLNILGKNARQFIFDNYNPEKYIASLNEIYKCE